MTRTSLIAIAAAALLLATGCTSSNRIVADKLTQTGSWYGELGITGHLNNVNVKAPSRITKLSIIGDANKIHVDDDVTLGKIEIWGGNNIINLPPHLVVCINQVGKGNQVVRRATTAELEAQAAQPPVEPNAMGERFIPTEPVTEEPIEQDSAPAFDEDTSPEPGDGEADAELE